MAQKADPSSSARGPAAESHADTRAAGRGMRCPICRRPSEERAADESGKSPYPFCSERCRLIDLGRWLDGVYQIPAAEHDEPTGEAGVTP